MIYIHVVAMLKPTHSCNPIQSSQLLLFLSLSGKHFACFRLSLSDIKKSRQTFLAAVYCMLLAKISLNTYERKVPPPLHNM